MAGGLIVSSLVLIFAMFMEIHAAPTISTSTPTPCYGDVVTLVCHHPDLATDPERYFSQPTAWMEDGVGINPTLSGSLFTAETASDLTRSTLNITITVDYFRNKSFNYSCLLVLAENGLPSGSQISVNKATVDPVEPRPPSIHTIISLNTSIAFNWIHTPMECYKDRISYNLSWVNIDNNTENGSDDTGEHMHNIAGLVVNNTYTISVRTVVDGNVPSTAVTKNVTTGQPLVRPQNPTQSACRSRSFTLFCEVPPVYGGSYSNISWMLNSTDIDSESAMYSTPNNGRELVIRNVTASTTGDYGCYVKLNNGTFVKGQTYSLQPLDSPNKPHNLKLTPGVTSISVSWEHDRSCFEDHQLEFIVAWQNVDTEDDSANETVNGTTFNIKDLTPDTNYSICVTATTSDGQVRSENRCLYTKTSELSIPGPSPLIVNLPYLALIIVVVALVGVIVAAGIYLWRKRRSRRVGCDKYESLWLLQVTDTLNRNGVKIISVRGHCVSAESDPCHCEREAATVDVYGTFNEKRFVMTFLKSGEDNMKGFIADLLQQKNNVSADYCFALWAGGSVPRKARSHFKKVPEWKKESCAVLPVQGFPWKVGSKEEKRFVQLFKTCFPPLLIKIEVTHQESFGLSRQEGEVTLTMEESEEVTVTIPHSDPPQVDVVKLVERLLINKPPTTEETDGDVKIPLESANASVTASPLYEYEPASLHSTDAPVSKQATSVVSGGRRRSYTRASFIDGVVSVLEILHVTILSVGNRCRRPECQDPKTCTHLSIFQPDVVGVCGDASFVVKYVLHHHDGDVTGDHMATLNNVRTGLGLPLGLLVYDHMERGPQLLSQQIPDGCSMVHVGAFTWDSNWVENTLIALCKAFKTPLAVDTSHPAQQVQYAHVLVDENRPLPNPPEEKTNYSEISAIGEKAAQLVEDKPPPVPPKKETNPMEEQFQTDVIEALTEIGMTLQLRELNLFTATYQSMKFLGVSWVESEVDVTPINVEKVVRAKNKMAASRAVLICNQDTIPSDQLLDLQKASCYFIKAGGYGTEKWKNRLISNFKDTVSDWMEEQNSGPHHSEKEEGGVGPPEEEEEVVGPPEEEEEVVGPPEEEEGGVGPPEEEEEVVGHPEEESQLNQPVEEARVTGRYGPVQGGELINRKPPTTGLTQFYPKVTACLDGSPQSSTPQHIYVAEQYDVVPEQETTERIPPMTLITRLESNDLSEEESPLSNSEVADTFEKEKNKNTAPMMERGDLGENYSKSPGSDINQSLESSQPPADPLRSQPHGGINHTQAGPVVGSFTSTFEYPLEDIFEYHLEDDDTVPLIQ